MKEDEENMKTYNENDEYCWECECSTCTNFCYKDGACSEGCHECEEGSYVRGCLDYKEEE